MLVPTKLVVAVIVGMGRGGGTLADVVVANVG